MFVLNLFPNKPAFLHACSINVLNTVGKGEIAYIEQFLLFPQRVLYTFGELLTISSSLKLSSANSFRMKQSRICHLLNSLPKVKILDVTKLKAFADDKIKVAQMMIPIFDTVKNIQAF